MKGPGLRKEILRSMREIVFGLEDSLVSTLGAVVGIAAGAPNRSVVILSGLVIVVVESISMAAGSYLSSKSVEQAEQEVAREEKQKSGRVHSQHPIRAAIVMGIFYVLGGCIPLAPFLFLPLAISSQVAVTVTAGTLFLVGMLAAWISRRSLIRGGMEMLVVSLSAAGAGYLIGSFVNKLFDIHV